MVLRFWDSLTISQKQAFVAWLFLSIPILFYLIIRFYPTFEAFYVSTVKWNILGNKKFIGINNFVKIINNEDFWIVLSNTVKYAVIGVPISLFLSFVIAYYLNEVTFGHETIRALYFIPFLTTAVLWHGSGGGFTSQSLLDILTLFFPGLEFLSSLF